MLETPAPPTDRHAAAPPPRHVVRVGSFEAIRRHWLLAALPLVVLVALALAYGLTRKPTYTAESRLSVGRIGLSSPGALNGFPVATAALASTYSRAITAVPVTNDVAKHLGDSPADVRTRITATPVPVSPIIRVIGTAKSEQAAINTANSAADALQRYIVSLNSDNPNATRLYDRYRAAATLAAQREQTLRSLESQFGSSPTPQQRNRLASAQANVDAAKLRLSVYSSAYADSQSTQSTQSILQSLSTASTASSDFARRLEIALFVAVCLGVLLGVALATARANRVVRRRAMV